MIQRMFVTLDTKKTNYKNVGKINHGDDLILELTVLSDGDMISFNDPMVDLLVKKSDGKMIRQNSGIEHIKPNKFVIEVSKDCVTSPGLSTNQLIINDNGRISTCMFYYTILNSLEEDIIESISNVEVLEQLDEFTIQMKDKMENFDEELQNRMSELEDAIDDLVEFFGDTSVDLLEAELSRNEAEQSRAQAESVRVQNENRRLQNDLDLANAEAERVRAENIRIQNEVDRALVDAVMDQKESKREDSELERIQNESKRIMDEVVRQQNENTRQSNESIRMSNETDRKTQENRRVTAETNRGNAETTRRNNENSRISNETARQQNENIRQKTMDEMKSLISDVDAYLDKLYIHTEINVLHLGLKGDGSIEDLSELNRFLAQKKENIKLIFPSNKVYRINEPIVIKADKSIIQVEGVVIADCDGLVLDDVNDCLVNINTIKSTKELNLHHDWYNGKYIDYEEFNSSGLRLNNVRNCVMNISRIQGYKNGLHLAPSTFKLGSDYTSSGIQYNIFNLGSIYGHKNCIHFQHKADGSWANSNTFNVGMLSGGYGVRMTKAEYKECDYFNQNNFYGTGMEYCRLGGILMEIGKENSFYNFRQDKVDEFYIKTGENSSYCTFDTNYALFTEGCQIKGKGHAVKGRLLSYSDTNNINSYEKRYFSENKKVSQTLVLTDNVEKHTEAFVLDENHEPFSDAYKFYKDTWGKLRAVAPLQSFWQNQGTNVTITIRNMNNIFYPDTRSGNVTYQFNTDVESIYMGWTFKILTTKNTDPSKVSFKYSNGNIANIPSLAQNKFYYLMNIGDGFKLIEVGDAL